MLFHQVLDVLFLPLAPALGFEESMETDLQLIRKIRLAAVEEGLHASKENPAAAAQRECMKASVANDFDALGNEPLKKLTFRNYQRRVRAHRPNSYCTLVVVKVRLSASRPSDVVWLVIWFG